MLDRNRDFLAAARALAHASPHAALSSAAFISSDLGTTKTFLPSPLVGDRGPISDSGAVAGPSVGALRSSARPTEAGAASATQTHDLVLAAYIFAELPAHARERALADLWDACRGILVIVEPGTPAGYATILASRTALLASGARMVAPCPAGYPCPIVLPDWCHFAERLPRSRAHMRAKDAVVPFEDEKFSYIALAREGVALQPAEARIVAPPRASKPGLRLRLCTEGGLAERTVLKRDKPAFKAVSRKTWGDAL